MLDVALPAAQALVAVGTIAGVVDAFVQRSQNKDMSRGVTEAYVSLMQGLRAGLSGGDFGLATASDDAFAIGSTAFV